MCFFFPFHVCNPTNETHLISVVEAINVKEADSISISAQEEHLAWNNKRNKCELATRSVVSLKTPSVSMFNSKPAWPRTFIGGGSSKRWNDGNMPEVPGQRDHHCGTTSSHLPISLR